MQFVGEGDVRTPIAHTNFCQSTDSICSSTLRPNLLHLSLHTRPNAVFGQSNRTLLGVGFHDVLLPLQHSVGPRLLALPHCSILTFALAHMLSKLAISQHNLPNRLTSPHNAWRIGTHSKRRSVLCRTSSTSSLYRRLVLPPAVRPQCCLKFSASVKTDLATLFF